MKKYGIAAFLLLAAGTLVYLAPWSGDRDSASSSEMRITMDESATLGGEALLRSSGSGAGPSVALMRMEDARSGDTSVSLSRGLTLVGFNPVFGPLELAHVDTCDPADPVADMTAPDVSFKKMIERSRGLAGGWAVIGHGSALCEQSGTVSPLEGLGLGKWRELEPHQPYIAVIAGDGQRREVPGPAPSTSLFVHVSHFVADVPTTPQREISALPRIAHAGGGYRGDTYTNSIDALDHNRDDYSLFEIDLLWTSDERLVCLHDWEQTFEHFFGEGPSTPLSLAAFQRLSEQRSDLEHCTLDSLVAWMEDNPRERIVTDVKQDNIRALRRIASHHPELMHRFVPQVYQPEEYLAARELGYGDVIWTLYRYPGSDDKVLELLPWMDLYGLTMPPERAERGLARRAREQRDVLSWVHTINEPETARRFAELGVASIYTDWLPAGNADNP